MILQANAVGIYVHIPYCQSLCPYCDFNSYVVPQPPWEALQQALCAELQCRMHAFASAPIASVFFGGGTPSLAPPALIAAVLQQIASLADVCADAEVTLEANPGTVDINHFRDLRTAGINRISLGWQSTHNKLLRVLGRGHSAADSHAAYEAARAAGFTNISLDLIFAVPGQSLSHLEHDLHTIVQLNPEHVSLYALTYHEGTPFYRRRQRGQLKPADDDLECTMMERIAAFLPPHGYEHYEVSNYARAGKHAQHNSLVWQGHRYLGVGPGAHSFHHEAWQRGWRWEACRDPRAYMAAWQAPSPSQAVPVGAGDPTVSWCERLTPKQLFAERMLCAMRQRQGIDLHEPICDAHADVLASGMRTALQHQWAELQDARLCPTPAGLQHADALAELFF